MSKYTREQIIKEAQRIAKKLGVQKLPMAEFIKESKIYSNQIYRLFPDDGWRGVLEAAGLEANFQNIRISEDAALLELHNIVKELRRIPTTSQFNARAKISIDVLQKRFGGMKAAIAAYRNWLERNHPNAPELELIPIKSKHELMSQHETDVQDTIVDSSKHQWSKADGTVFGAPISFRGLRHAPINEQGVVYLFGMVSAELGLIVEAIQSAFPDCEAKRCIDHKSSRWQRVRVEFEYYSSNFKDHGHDPNGCDMIVCWEHDWNDCPLEVVELRSVIDKLEG